jgi:hypothetical protein
MSMLASPRSAIVSERNACGCDAQSVRVVADVEWRLSMINTIACPHCKRAISYERSDLYTPERSLRIECTNCTKPVLLVMTEDGDVTAKPK